MDICIITHQQLQEYRIHIPRLLVPGLDMGHNIGILNKVKKQSREAYEKILQADRFLDADKLTVKAKDNEYAAAVALLNANGSKLLSVKTPNQTVKNTEVTVEPDLTDIYGNKFLVAVYDYARNATVYEVELNLGSYYSTNLSGMAWDHNAGKLDIPCAPRRKPESNLHFRAVCVRIRKNISYCYEMTFVK